MENYVVYEELAVGSSSIVYKGRKKGTLNYVAVICADKAKRPAVTNHVRLSRELNHPNIASFYEWYETNNHLWLVVELCTGGSLESVIDHDNGCPEDLVRKFGWDLVKGLKHIHEIGIIFSDLNPSKILLDGSGILKFGNFCMSKLAGEKPEDYLSLFATSEDRGEQNSKVDKVKKNPQDSYCAPEVLQGSETCTNSDLWSLGCILYYMYNGKPPFISDSYEELTEMILHQEPRPHRQTGISSNPPSEDFQNLLKGLLNKNTDKRMNWPELMSHPFWTQVVKEDVEVYEGSEDGHQEENSSYEGPGQASSRDSRIPNIFSPGQTNEHRHIHPAIIHPDCGVSKTHYHEDVRHTICGDLRNGKDDLKWSQTEQIHTSLPNKSLTLDQVSEIQPKFGGDEDNTEAIFLLSSSANSRRSCSISDSLNRTAEPQASTGTDIKIHVNALLHSEADLTVVSIIDNPKILKTTPGRFDPKTLCVPAYSVEKLQSLSDEKWSAFISQLCAFLEQQKPSAHPSSTASAHAAQPTVIRSRLNLLCYLCNVVGHELIANRLMNSALLPALTKQLRQTSNWDVRSKVLKLMGLLASRCSDLGEKSPVSEVVSTLTDLLRDNLRNSKIKQLLLPPLGEFLYLIASQEKKRGSPEGLWFVPAAAYTGLMRSLREGDDSVVHHMAVKAIENIATTVSGPSHPLVTTDIGSNLWHLFIHSTVEAVRVAAISALSRLTRVVPTVFLAVIDIWGPAAILEDLGGAGSRVQQHLLTALATTLLSSHSHTRRITQNKDWVLKVLRCLESPSIVTRAKASLLLLLLIKDNTHTLFFCCEHRLVMYIERDLRKTAPIRQSWRSAYLSQCLDLLVGYLSNTSSTLLEDVLSALQCVIGRKHPSAAQSRKLKQTLPALSVVLHLLLSQFFRSQMVTRNLVAQIGLLLKYISSADSTETNLASALGVTVCEELIKTSLSIVEVLSQHHALTSRHNNVVVGAILPPLASLAFSRNVEWSVFVLRVLSELTMVLLVQESDRTDNRTDKIKREQKDREAKEIHGGSQMLTILNRTLLSRFESLLWAPEPIPLYALKLLVSMTEHCTQICSMIKHNTILPAVFQVIMDNNSNVNSGLIQNAVALLCNLGVHSVLDLEPVIHEGLIEVVVSTLSEAALVYLNEEGHDGRKVSHLVLQALLELLHGILKQTSVLICSALQSQRLSCPTAEIEAAEKLLLQNRPLSQLSTHLIHMISTENRDIWEESLQCLSLLVQLYRGEGDDCLTPSCLGSFSHTLRTHLQTEMFQIQRTTLSIIKRLVQTTEHFDWLQCHEGAELKSLLQDISTSNRCHVDVAPLAAEILRIISGF